MAVPANKTNLSSSLPSDGFLEKIVQSHPGLLVSAIEACPTNISFADARRPDMPLIYVNPSFTVTTGYTGADVIGRNCRFLQGEETDHAAVAKLRECIDRESDVEVEILNYRKDGVPFINALKMAPVHDAAGDLISYVGVQHDVTKQRAEEESRVGRQRLEALGELSGSVAHQLNNMLQPIMSLVSLHKPDVSDSTFVADLESILESTRQASHIVRDVLHFSSQTEKAKAALLMSDEVINSVNFIRGMLPLGMHVQVVICAQARGARALINTIEFCQALTNLMINASQATGGSGHIEVNLDLIGDDQVSVSVSDDGPGIPQDLRSRILEPFFTTRGDSGGTGLGLSVVYGFVKGAGGTLSIGDSDKPEFGSGSKISMNFPLAK